jgi:hypothetical protein
MIRKIISGACFALGLSIPLGIMAAVAGWYLLLIMLVCVLFTTAVSALLVGGVILWEENDL